MGGEEESAVCSCLKPLSLSRIRGRLGAGGFGRRRVFSRFPAGFFDKQKENRIIENIRSGAAPGA